ncbi:MAG: hypothetical protein ACLGHY_04510 [Gammaproteobacteria bacterium]
MPGTLVAMFGAVLPDPIVATPRMNDPFDAEPAPRMVMLPSVAGGIGHLSPCAALARAMRRLCPAAAVEFVLETVVAQREGLSSQRYPGAPCNG